MPTPLRILVIDDDPVMRELLEALLGFAGHAPEVVDSGESGLARLAAATPPFDVVLTDLHMPGIQGHELATELLAHRSPTTLLLGMSGSYPTEDETRLLDVFLQKPFTPDQFEQAVAAARQHLPQTQPPAAQPEPATTPVLNEDIFTRLAAQLPAAQLRGLYDLTLTDVQARVALMQTSLAANDLDAVRREAHAIKGGCGMVGAAELYHLASTTEGGIAADAMPLADFAPACDRLRRMLNERL